MEPSAEVWYFSDMIDRTVSRLPNIDAGPAGRVSVVGTIKDKTTITARTTKSFPSYALVMVHEGRGTFESGDALAVERGDLLLLFPGVPHSYGPAPGKQWDESYIVFTGELFDALRNGDVISSDCPVIRHLDDRWQERFLGLVRLAGAAMEANATAAKVETPAPVYLCMLASFIAEAATAHPVPHVKPADAAWLDKAYTVLDGERPMSQSLADVAGRLSTSYGSFVKRFTRLAGTAPGQARNRMVMEHACTLLREGELTVGQIADHLGFADTSYFCRRFRTLVGYTPTEFRHMTGGDA